MNFFEKFAASMTLMNPDSTTWIKTVITTFLNQYPQLQKLPISVIWKKTDFDKGFAVGTLEVFGGHIPVIIRDFQMYPLDILLIENAAIPLTPETLQELLTSPTPFLGAQKIKSKGSLELFGDGVFNMSPIEGTASSIGGASSVTRDAVKVASVAPGTLKNFLQEFKNQPTEIQEKLAFYLDSVENLEVYEEKPKSYDVQVKFTGPDGNSIVKKASLAYDYETTDFLSVKEAKSFKNIFNAENKVEITKTAASNEFSDGITLKLAANGTETPFFTILDVKRKPAIEKYACFSLFDESGTIIVDKAGSYLISTEKADEFAPEMQKIAYTEPSIGDTGVFIINSKATRPITIDSMVKIANGPKDSQEAIIGTSNMQKIAYYFAKFTKDALVQHSIEKNAFYLPKNAKFVKLATALDNSKADLIKRGAELVKQAGNVADVELTALQNGELVKIELRNDVTSIEKVGNHYVAPFTSEISYPAAPEAIKVAQKISPVTVMRDSVGLYAFSGNPASDFQKLGHKISSLSIYDAQWTSVRLGANENDFKKIATLKNNETYTLTNNCFCPKPANLEKTSSVKSVPVYLFKEAAMLSDNVSVDSLLSLGLMDSVNIYEYLDYIEEYERLVGELAKLLIISRLGAGLDPAPISTTIQQLTKVIYMLKQLKSAIAEDIK